LKYVVLDDQTSFAVRPVIAQSERTMRIRIDDSGDARSQSVRFSSAAGQSTAVWRGQTLPDPGDYDVELELPIELHWGRDLRELETPASSRQPTDTG
jgi:hypothetical protein